MDIYKEKFTKVQREIMTFLIIHTGESFSQRDIAKKLTVSPTAITQSIEGIKPFIHIKPTKTINFIAYNQDSKKALIYKKITNLRLIHDSGLVSQLTKENPGGTILLFGSYSRGEDDHNSDIDIAIIGRKSKKSKLDSFAQILNRPINIQYYDSFRKIHENLRNNILNGILLSGSIVL